MSRLLNDKFEYFKGYYVNEAARAVKEKNKKAAVSSSSTYLEMPLPQGNTTAPQSSNPILAVDENGKVIKDRYWETVTVGYKRIR